MTASNGSALFNRSVDGGRRLRQAIGRDWDSDGAVQRMLADAAEAAGCDHADLVLASLRTAVSQAFATGEDRSWRELYTAVSGIIERSTHTDGPAYSRLCAFLEENADLAERPSFA